MDKVALGQDFLRALRFSRVSIIPPLFHIDSYIVWGMDKGSVRDPVPQRRIATVIACLVTCLTFSIEIP
jgi:hypothetical protein